jgi:hypothetical protein
VTTGLDEVRTQLLAGFGGRLRQLRKDCGIKQKDLADEAGPEGQSGYSNRTVSDKENGVGARAPEWDFVRWYVAACQKLQQASARVDKARFSEEEWRKTYDALMRSLELTESSAKPGNTANEPERGGPSGQASPVKVYSGGVTQLLRPEREVVRFWPRAELAALGDWVESGEHVAIQLVHGTGGAGKTRLALELAKRTKENGWLLQWVHRGTEQEAAELAGRAKKKALLVVDYAEVRSNLPKLLADATSNTDGPGVRVLLLARSAGEWWRQLIYDSDNPLSVLLQAIESVALGAVSGSFGKL